MAAFVLNKGYSSEEEIAAHTFTESGSLVIFTGNDGGKVFAVPTAKVHTIQLAESE